jgi:ABC-2 type transport system permease protein
MTKRSLRHTTRSLDTIITVVLTPIALLLLFVYVFGGALGEQTGSVDYVDFITPGILIMTVASGIAYAGCVSARTSSRASSAASGPCRWRRRRP